MSAFVHGPSPWAGARGPQTRKDHALSGDIPWNAAFSTPSPAGPATRVARAGGAGPPPPTFPPAGAPGGHAQGGVGKATVERIVAANVQQAKKSQSRTYLAVIAVVVVLFLGVAAVGGFFVWRGMNATKTAASDEVAGLKKSLDEAKATEATSATMKAADVVKQYGGAVVKIDVAWKLVSQQGNGLVYHQYMVFQGQPRACYVRLQDGTIEPYLTYNSNPLNVGIGGRHPGSG